MCYTLGYSNFFLFNLIVDEFAFMSQAVILWVFLDVLAAFPLVGETVHACTFLEYTRVVCLREPSF